MTRQTRSHACQTISKLFPNFLTMTDAPSERQKVGYTDFKTFFFSALMTSIHCSALTAAGRKKARGSPYLPHGPKLFARHLARRRGIPRTSRCKKECCCPCEGTVYEVRSCPTRCLYWVTVMCLPAAKSSISRAFKSIRRRAQTVSMGFKSPLQGGKRTECMPFLR